jgi:hypothetical protein
MPVYTVHEPRKLTGNPVRDAERFQFVRDGFHFWAFLLGPVWMLFRRMWLVFLLYMIVTVAVQFGLTMLGMSAAVNFVVGFLIALLVGFEAGTLRRFTLRRWRNVGSVVGVNRDEAERRFFDAWVAREEYGQPLVDNPDGIPPGANVVRTQSSDDVIGLFPEPERR